MDGVFADTSTRDYSPMDNSLIQSRLFRRVDFFFCQNSFRPKILHHKNRMPKGEKNIQKFDSGKKDNYNGEKWIKVEQSGKLLCSSVNILTK